MKDRMLTVLGALAAGLAVYALAFGSGNEPPVSRPVSTESGRNGYRAVAAWLASEGVAVESFRTRFDESVIADERLPPVGNILITTMPHRYAMRRTEQQVLRAWVRLGNTLLVLAALDDTPEWTAASATLTFTSQLEALTGVEFDAYFQPFDSGEAPGGVAPVGYGIDAKSEVVFEPVVEHPLLTGVTTLRGYSDGISSIWQPSRPTGDGLLLRLAAEQSSGLGGLWQLPVDSGQILVSASGTLLSNHTIGESDAAAFLANVIQHHLAPDGAVIFDDMHQGLSALYDPAAFYGDPRLRASLYFLVAAWLAWLVGSSNRLAPPVSSRELPRHSDLHEAVGGLMARRLDRRTMGRMMLDEWMESVTTEKHIEAGAGESGWSALARVPALSPTLRADLERCHERLQHDRPVDLTRLHNLLNRARKAIG